MLVEEDAMAVLRVLTHEGDDAIEYDPGLDDGRLEKARSLFDAKVGRGYLAFVPDESRSGGTQIRRFDPNAREIILQPAISGG
jgi:hypothetical protein